MDEINPKFEEFRDYWERAEGMIAKASKEEIVDTARMLAMQVAHFARKYGELGRPDLRHLLSVTSVTDDSVVLLRDGAETLVGALEIITGRDGSKMG